MSTTKTTRRFKTYILIEGLGVNNEPSFLLLGEGVICQYFNKKTHTKEEAINKAKEHLALFNLTELNLTINV